MSEYIDPLVHAIPERNDTHKLYDAMTYFAGGETIFLDVGWTSGKEEVPSTSKDNAFLSDGLSSMSEVHTSSTESDSSDMPC